MNASSDDISLIIFALLAVFVIWKLRSVLGTRVGNEPRPPEEPFGVSGPNQDGHNHPSVFKPASSPAITAADPANRARLEAAPDRWQAYAQPGSKLWAGLDAVARVDPAFDPAAFLRGASVAYEMVVAAYAKGERDTLRNLLSPDVFDSFDRAMRASDEKGEQRETTIVSVEPPVLEDAQLVDGVAQLTVRFASKLISATRDRTGVVVEGNPELISDHLDNWTFARRADARDPNWRLVATDSLV